jgi:uncharacterized damage-inducible protein DinB
MQPSARVQGFRGEFLWEWEIAERQLTAIAGAIPAEKYGWRPGEKARSVSEILIHVAAGNFMLLEVLGAPVPRDLYPDASGPGEERMWSLIRRNDELEKSIREKNAVGAILKRSIDAVRGSVASSDETELDRRLHFFGEQTTARRVYLRLLAHAHEHMGQMIAYLRMNGLNPPWPDWRPDRQ